MEKRDELPVIFRLFGDNSVIVECDPHPEWNKEARLVTDCFQPFSMNCSQCRVRSPPRVERRSMIGRWWFSGPSAWTAITAERDRHPEHSGPRPAVAVKRPEPWPDPGVPDQPEPAGVHPGEAGSQSQRWAASGPAPVAAVPRRRSNAAQSHARAADHRHGPAHNVHCHAGLSHLQHQREACHFVYMLCVLCSFEGWVFLRHVKIYVVCCVCVLFVWMLEVLECLQPMSMCVCYFYTCLCACE